MRRNTWHLFIRRCDGRAQLHSRFRRIVRFASERSEPVYSVHCVRWPRATIGRGSNFCRRRASAAATGPVGPLSPAFRRRLGCPPLRHCFKSPQWKTAKGHRREKVKRNEADEEWRTTGGRPENEWQETFVILKNLLMLDEMQNYSALVDASGFVQEGYRRNPWGAR